MIIFEDLCIQYAININLNVAMCVHVWCKVSTMTNCIHTLNNYGDGIATLSDDIM